MCQSEKISWATYGLGSVLNTTMLLLLWLLPPAERVLSLQGTTAIIIYQFALTVQVADALTWRRVARGLSPLPWFTFALIVFQPIVGGIASIWTWTETDTDLFDVGRLVTWGVWGCSVAGLLVVATCGRRCLRYPIRIDVTDDPTAKLAYAWHDSYLLNFFYSAGVLSVPFVMYAPWGVPLSLFAQILAGYVGSLAYLNFRATASFWCWTSFPNGALAAGAAYIDQSSTLHLGLYIAGTALVTLAAVPYRLYRACNPRPSINSFPSMSVSQ